ncbi:hypothetical protein LLG96_01980 [bacterium]|nr:hypothetical protein [bacterium]
MKLNGVRPCFVRRRRIGNKQHLDRCVAVQVRIIVKYLPWPFESKPGQASFSF